MKEVRGLALVLLGVACLSWACAKEKTFSGPIQYPSGWPANVTLPSSAKPCRTLIVSRVDRNGTGYSCRYEDKDDGFLEIIIGFEDRSGMTALKKHMDGQLLNTGYSIMDQLEGRESEGSREYRLSSDKDKVFILVRNPHNTTHYGLIFRIWP